MALHLNIVASCTDRKRGLVADERRLRTIPMGDAWTRAAWWWETLTITMPASGVEASQVYVGEHWNLVKGLATTLRHAGWQVDLWIASAGYGLLSERTRISPYSATFSDCENASEQLSDKVALGRVGAASHEYHRAWWAALAELRDDGGLPTTLAGVARKSPSSALLLLGSPDYVRATQDDLATAAGQLNAQERLVVLTSGDGWADSPLLEHLVLVDARARTAWGGTMQGIHARTAQCLLCNQQGHFSARELRDTYTRMVGDIPKPEKLNRKRMSDGEVIDFLRAELAVTPDASWLLLLRKLRQCGLPFEQRRFRDLHADLSTRVRAGRQSPDAGDT